MDRDAVRSAVVVQVGTAAVEVEEARVGTTINRTAPIIAVATDIVERTIAVEAEFLLYNNKCPVHSAVNGAIIK